MKNLRKTMVWNLVTVVVLYFFIRNGVAETKPYLINCGANSSTNANGRKWVGDSASDNGFTLSSSGISVSTAQVNGNSKYENLYKTARIFTEPMNYSFRIDPGSYYLRFHFYPFLVEDHNVNDSLFEVMANSLKLVSGFNIPGEIFRKKTYVESLGRNYTSPALLKEYFLSINSPQLVIKLIPAVGSFAFLNAMEIIPVNKKIFTDSANKVGGGNGASGSLNLNERGIETMYRLNVGGQEIEPNEDPDLWRVWESDNGYMFTSYAASEAKNSSSIAYASSNDSLIAPLPVYETARVMIDNEVLEKRFNMSWKFNVDPNFDYLVRLHFCELIFDKPNMRVFRIYINNRTAAEQFDVFARAGGKNIAYHQDYLDAVSSQTNTIWVQLGPDTSAGASLTDALLNGLEIFKLSRNGNLAQPLEKIGLSGNPGSRKVLESKALWVGIGAGVASIAALAVLSALLYRQYQQRQKMPPTKTHNPGWRPLFLHGTFGNSTTNMRGSKFPSGSMNGNGSMATTRIGRRFTLVELKIATNNFDEALVIGVGGFGKVYKGEIEEGVLAAIKRAHPQSEQGLAEFETEIEMLSMLRHRHLVSMIGFCEEQNEMILVYEYMANGTLRSHLFGNDLPPLTWKQRIDICIGAARGLYYLHTGSDRGIIHRDVKTTNILLDENFVAKMADFGLSRTGPAMDHTHVSTAVKGSFGYLDPEYFRRQQLTEKSDVYSFGVVLFEVVCGRPVIDPSLPKDQINLAEWVMRWQRQGSLETIVDPKLTGNYSKESLTKFGEIAEKCLADEGKNRPTMGEVLWHLEYIMQLHEASLRNNNGGDGGFSSGSEIPARLDAREERNGQTSSDIIKSQEEEEEEEEEAPVRQTVILDGAMGVDEFSQLVHPQGR